MDAYLIWVIAGFVLAITEVVTGTFFLLVLGVAAFCGALVAWTGGAASLQAIVAAAVAVSGALWVQRYRSSHKTERMQSIDFGQPAMFEAWVNQGAGHARVKYRDTLWDAIIAAEGPGQAAVPGVVAPGDVLYVQAIDGNTLKVSRTRPS